MRSDIEALKQDSYRTEVIVEADRSMLGSSRRTDITGGARAWLQRGIGEACDVAARWCALVGRDNGAREPGAEPVALKPGRRATHPSRIRIP